MDAGPWQAAAPTLPPPPTIPPPPTVPPPRVAPGYGYAVALPQQRLYGYSAPPGHWPQSYPVPTRRPRTSWVAWLAVGLAFLAASVPVVGTFAAGAGSDRSGLHSVSGISQASWSAEFVDASGQPARWDPCSPIHYVVDPSGAPAGAMSDVSEAFRRLSAASGLNFVNDGTTSERPSQSRDPYQPASYGATWAPILISWSSARETDLLDDPRAEAVTVPIAVNSRAGSGGGSLVSAEVVVNAARQLPVGFGPGPSEGEVLMHEFGHAVGLGHVSSMSEAMYPSVRGVAEYGSGDLAGLTALGAPAGCHAAPAPRRLSVTRSPLG